MQFDPKGIRMNAFKYLIAAASLAVTVSAADATVVLTTSEAGYAGPVIDLSGYTGYYTFTNGPLSLPNGVTYEAVGTDGQGGSVIGTGGYGFLSNGGSVTTPLIGTNWYLGYIELTFDQAISSFGGFFNYSPDLTYADNPFIAAYDALGNLLASFDISDLAPISTPSGLDLFAFRGMESDSADIASIRFGGSYLAFAPTIAAVPVPASLPLLLVALGGLGVAARRRKTA
jgi:hypothetical protein